MTREEAIQFLDNMKHEEAGRAIGKDGFYAELMGYHVKALNMAIKALEQEPCEDTISRQAVIDAIDKWVKAEHILETLPTDKVTPLFKNVHKLLSVNSQPKTGHWMDKGSLSCRCNQCGCKNNRETKFCPNCSCRMVEPQESEE